MSDNVTTKLYAVLSLDPDNKAALASLMSVARHVHADSGNTDWHTPILKVPAQAGQKTSLAYPLGTKKVVNSAFFVTVRPRPCPALLTVATASARPAMYAL
jgi:hypothetical protein